jgi:hypothetical protein
MIERRADWKRAEQSAARFFPQRRQVPGSGFLRGFEQN